MAVAKFHSDRGTKSALILVKANQYVMNFSPVYVPRDSITESQRTATVVQVEGKDVDVFPVFQIPDGFKLAPMIDVETGEVRTTNSGEPLHTLAY